MIKTRFIWRNFCLESSFCIRRMCGGCPIDIALWFLPTASSHNLKTNKIFPMICCNWAIEYLGSSCWAKWNDFYVDILLYYKGLFRRICKTSDLLWYSSKRHIWRNLFSLFLFNFWQIPIQRWNCTRRPTLFLFCFEQQQQPSTCFGHFRLFCRLVWFGGGWVDYQSKCQPRRYNWLKSWAV